MTGEYKGKCKMADKSTRRYSLAGFNAEFSTELVFSILINFERIK